MKICIRSLDENLAHKMNKSMMPVIENQLKDNFVAKEFFDQLKTKLNQDMIKIGNSRLDMEKSFKDIKDEVRRMV